MKLNYTDGCTCTSLTVDEEESIDMPIEDFRKVIYKLLTDIVDDNDIFKQVIIDYVEEGLVAECEDEDVRITNRALTIGKDEYKIKYAYIGYYDYLFVNGNFINELPDNEIKELACHAILVEDDIANLQWVFTHVLEQYGKYTYIGHCECCGDSICEYSMNI